MSTIAIDARIISTTTGRYVERLIHYLEKLDSEHEYLLLVRKKDLDFYKPKSKRFRIIVADFEDYSLGEQFGLAKLLYKLKPDLVHFCMPQQPIFYTGKHVTTVHDLILLTNYNSDKNFIIYKIKQFIGRFVFYLIGHTSAHIIVPTKFTRDAYAKFARLGHDKITVTYEGCDFAQVTAEPYADLQNKQFLLYVGQQSDYKNIRRLMQAHQQLRKKYPALLLVLVGKLSGKNGVPLMRNKQWASEQGFKGIIYTDFVPDSQLRWLYEHCATYVYPSLAEGFGLPGLEAMASGAPVASSNATCLPEVYQNAAIYFDPKDVTAMAKTIDQVMSDKKLRQKLIDAGKHLVPTYSWETMASQTLLVYNKVLAVSKRAGS